MLYRLYILFCRIHQNSNTTFKKYQMRIDKHLSFETLYPSIPCMQIHFLDVHLDEIENIPAFLTLILGKKK